MSKAGPQSTTRRALFKAAPAICVASIAVAGSATASPTSPAVQKAFDDWQAAYADYRACDALNDASQARYDAMLPERCGWKMPLSAEQHAAIDAALELSGHKATEEATMAAYDVSADAFLAFLAVTPATMADIQLQATHLAEWLQDAHVEHPALVWLSALTGENWVRTDDEGDVA